jgi:hypothetical protein
VNDVTTAGCVGMIELWQAVYMMENLMHVHKEFPLAGTLSCTVRLICVSMFLSHLANVQNGEIFATCISDLEKQAQKCIKCS